MDPHVRCPARTSALGDDGPLAMLIVAQETRIARDVSGRVMMFDVGGIVEDGAPDQIFSDPA
jgi:ABC-type histidine transport system ATPase subunit